MITTHNQTQAAPLFHTNHSGENFAQLFPRFIQLTPEYKVSLNQEVYRMTEQSKRERLMVKMPISGELEGGIIAYLNPSHFSPNDIHIITGVFCESINILAGHFLTRLDQEEDLMCSLHLPVIYSANSEKEHNYDFLKSLENNGVEIESFELDGTLDNQNKSGDLLVQIFLMRKEVK
jgi:hypothetical protein